MSDRITLDKLRERLNEWNDRHADLKMSYNAWENHVSIYLANDAGGIEEIIAEGRTAREAWEQFYVWRNGYYFGFKDALKEVYGK